MFEMSFLKKFVGCWSVIFPFPSVSFFWSLFYWFYLLQQTLPNFHYMLHDKTYSCNSTPTGCPDNNRLSTGFWDCSIFKFSSNRLQVFITNSDIFSSSKEQSLFSFEISHLLNVIKLRDDEPSRYYCLDGIFIWRHDENCSIATTLGLSRKVCI